MNGWNVLNNLVNDVFSEPVYLLFVAWLVVRLIALSVAATAMSQARELAEKLAKRQP
jgi:hypothetical protein